MEKGYTFAHISKLPSTLVVDLFAVACALFLLISCSPKTTDGVPDCAITQPLDALISEMFESDGPGAVVMVCRNDTVMFNKCYGLATLDSERPVTDSTIFNLSSASKIFTSTAVMKLVEDGRICLDDSLTKFFPEFNNKFFDKVKIRHLLSHTSGLLDLRPHNEEEWDDYLDRLPSIFTNSPDYRLYSTETEHLHIFKHLSTVDHEAGTFYDRTDASYVLLAPLIERATGEDFDKWMKENIFDPAGLQETFYYNMDTYHPRLAHGYKRAVKGTEPVSFRSDDGEWDEYDYAETEFFLTKADRGACSSARDFMKFKEALFNGDIISKESIDQMCQPIINIDNLPYTYYGLGVAVKDLPDYPRRIYHLNNNGGFASLHASFPAKDLHYLVFSSHNDWDLRETAAKIDSIFKEKGWI